MTWAPLISRSGSAIAEDKIWSKDDLPTIVANTMMIVQMFLDLSFDKDQVVGGSRG